MNEFLADLLLFEYIEARLDITFELNCNKIECLFTFHIMSARSKALKLIITSGKLPKQIRSINDILNMSAVCRTIRDWFKVYWGVIGKNSKVCCPAACIKHAINMDNVNCIKSKFEIKDWKKIMDVFVIIGAFGNSRLLKQASLKVKKIDSLLVYGYYKSSINAAIHNVNTSILDTLVYANSTQKKHWWLECVKQGDISIELIRHAGIESYVLLEKYCTQLPRDQFTGMMIAIIMAEPPNIEIARKAITLVLGNGTWEQVKFTKEMMTGKPPPVYIVTSNTNNEVKQVLEMKARNGIVKEKVCDLHSRKVLREIGK